MGHWKSPLLPRTARQLSVQLQDPTDFVIVFICDIQFDAYSTVPERQSQ